MKTRDVSASKGRYSVQSRSILYGQDTWADRHRSCACSVFLSSGNILYGSHWDIGGDPALIKRFSNCGMQFKVRRSSQLSTYTLCTESVTAFK